MESLLIVFPIIFICLFIYLGQALWIYLDSKRRGHSYSFLWPLLALISFPVPLIIYLIIYKHDETKCTNCGKSIDKTMRSCPYCGENSKKSCSNCGYLLENNWNYCPNCNKIIN
jgi:RNA polymerase subunit RPABC4/transcription elongation factor Spt4